MNYNVSDFLRAPTRVGIFKSFQLTCHIQSQPLLKYLNSSQPLNLLLSDQHDLSTKIYKRPIFKPSRKIPRNLQWTHPRPITLSIKLYKHLMSHLPTKTNEEMTSLSTSLLGIRRASSNKNKAVEKTKNAAFCKKHPKHRQSPGVCSLCLNEKLSIFIKASSSSRRQRSHQILCSSSTTSSLSSYGSSSVSSCPSPLVDRRRFLLMSGGNGRGEKGISWMTKSRSVAHKVEDEKRKKTSKGRFLFGLIDLTRRTDSKRRVL